ncbi:MAG: hypothetical protein K9G64_04535, partial [Bacteroidia bacterium]|nr:hypothetical protein [Bacteroidia bacterium]
DDPQINATYFLVLVSGLNFTGFVFIINFINEGLFPNPYLYFILAYLIPTILHLRILFFYNGGYKRKMKKYEFLSNKENRISCYKYLILSAIFSTLFMFSCILILKR